MIDGPTHMKKFLLSAVSLASLASTAIAADLPSRKAPIVAPPSPMWTGFYAGLNIGYGFGASSSSNTTTVPIYDGVASTGVGIPSAGLGIANSGVVSLNQNGVIGGGQIGYNYLTAQNFLLGLEADFQGSGIYGNGSYTAIGSDAKGQQAYRNTIGTGSVSSSLDWFGTVRGRIGYLATPSILIFGTGGLTYGGVSANLKNTSISSYWDFDPTTYTQLGVGGASQTNTLVGWNAGGGVEWMFMQNWSAKAEAFYYDLGSSAMSGYVSGLAPTTSGGRTVNEWIYSANTTTKVNYNGIIARAGINYHFNFASAPVVAKF